ncbi:hypothetical protein [Emticicia sp. SJ17W-69]|uniref:hypothetical protein n=1 Tax=Emticicia sp. SJ17W-69 TaxID=3421657 RepID=UPI003EB7E7BB
MGTPEEKNNWVYITPIYNLEITGELDKEIKIGRVTFIDIAKIPYVRKRLGLPCVFSVIISKKYENIIFKESKTYAFLIFRGDPEEKKEECRLIIEEAVNILSLSQLGYCSRQNNSQFGIIKQRDFANSYILNKSKFIGSIHMSFENKVLPFCLNKEWRNFHDNFFFFNLIAIISTSNKEIQVKWKDTIVRAAVMIGKSMKSRDLETCFIWNMIIVEMLLTEQGDKYTDMLPERVEAFIGWVGYWKEEKFEEKIRELYKKRCEFIHDGNSKNIKIEDLLFMDNLVFNLMWNIVNHISLFPTKKSIVEFSEKIKAEKLLGIKSKVLPKTFKFMNREYDEDDYKKI